MATLARPVLLCLLLSGAACGFSSHARLGPIPGPLYTVTTTVMQKPGEAYHACFATPLPWPPIGCGGPDVASLDLSTVTGATRYSNAVIGTPMLRLVGTWDGRALNLTRPPEGVPAAAATSVTECRQAPGTTNSPDMPAVMKKVIADDALLKARGIQVLEFSMCNDSLFMVVPVADQPTVVFLTSRYSPVQVAGWLQPVA